jgi:hypothetical protein
VGVYVTLSASQLRLEIARQIRTEGGLCAWCDARGLSYSSVSLAVNGRRDVSEAVANAAGFLREISYRSLTND